MTQAPEDLRHLTVLDYPVIKMKDLPVETILRIAEKHGVRNVRVFGSRARGEAGPDSDLDLLVEYGGNMSLLDVIGFEQELEECIGIRVETVNERALHRVIKEQVLAEARPLVAA